MYTNWDKYLEEAQPKKHHHKNPSFSSLLLEEVLRSIDGDNQVPNSLTRKPFNEVEATSFWDNDSTSFSTTSRSNSSDSSFSSGGSFLSEAEYSSASNKPSKPSRAGASGASALLVPRRSQDPQKVIKNNEDFVIKSKSRAMKIYANLKKVKQPISPGGRLTSFINSLFSSENSKKMKNMHDGGHKNAIFSSEDSKKVKNKNVGVYKNAIFTSENLKKMRNKNDGVNMNKYGNFGWKQNSTNNSTSPCSQASSSSRSCLSKNFGTYLKEKFDDGLRRKVTFFHASSMILDDDFPPCGYQSNVEIKGLKNVENYDDEDEENDDDDDEEDLFEIDHLGLFGNERFCDELPVYGTTHVKRLDCGLMS